MRFSAGVRLGPYEIQQAIGAGGMGEVYKAVDTRLNRIVALKVLPDALAADPQFRERFEREARTISQLTHPHICTLYDVGHADGTEFLVMEYLEGETLAARLSRISLPVDQALAVAMQIGDALDRAHHAGIVHRDLKPGNIVLTKSGAKLLDFGLAKTGRAGVVASGVSMLPTTPPAQITAQGTILGTFQYMAPEQIEGRDADARTDILAFGCVLYEMLTGKTAFAGRTHASLISSILKDEPLPVSQIVRLVPPALNRIVRTYLAKNSEDRFQSARDVVLQLRDALDSDSSSAVPSAAVRRRSPIVVASIAIASAAIAAVVAWTIKPIPKPARPVIPHILPGGQTILFTQSGSNNWDDAEAVVQTLATGARKTVMKGGLGFQYLSTGHLVFIRQHTLFAARFGRIAALDATADFHHGLPGFGQRGQNPSQVEPLPEIPPHLRFVPLQVAERMLDLATRNDVVYDLGCGDGRVAILAARKYGARSVGVDVDPKRIAEANANAEKAGVSNLVRFVQPTIDVSEASVLTMSIPQSSAWLTQNGLLHPTLTKQLKAGSRIVTNFVSGSMKDWKPDQVDHFPDARGNARAILYLWKYDGSVRP